MSVQSGDVVGLAGLLGSGRSETARLIFGIEPADSGEVHVNGKRIDMKTPRDAIFAGIAYCSEDRKRDGILGELSVRENIILALQASQGVTRRLSHAEQRELADHYIRALSIKTPSSETPIRALSGGNQQKVLLGRWLAMQPKVMILDEPTRGIDVGAKAEIEKVIEDLRSRGMAVLFISSELEELTRNCNRVLVLRDRRQSATLEGDEVQVDHIMHAIAHSSAGTPNVTEGSAVE
jgi:simple sugar transport system ATP-binding protein